MTENVDYQLAALVGFETVLNASHHRFKELRTAQLDVGLALIPITRELLLELSEDRTMSLNKAIPDCGEGNTPDRLTPPLVSLALELSAFSPLAFFAAEYLAGAGQQTSILWQGQKLIMGPLVTTWGKFGNPLNKFRQDELAINTVLKRMGVRTIKGKDEFDTIGLGRKRATEAWC